MSQIYKSLVSGPVPPSVATTFHTNDGDAVPAANILNVYGGTGATTSGSGNTVTVTVKNDGFAWSDASGDFSAVAQNGYFCTGALTATLPASAGLVTGNTIIIYVDSASVVVVQSNVGQTIQIGSSQTAIAGSVSSTSEGSVLTLVYRESDSEWHSVSVEGSWV